MESLLCLDIELHPTKAHCVLFMKMRGGSSLQRHWDRPMLLGYGSFA